MKDWTDISTFIIKKDCIRLLTIELLRSFFKKVQKTSSKKQGGQRPKISPLVSERKGLSYTLIRAFFCPEGRGHLIAYGCAKSGASFHEQLGFVWWRRRGTASARQAPSMYRSWKFPSSLKSFQAGGQ